MNLLVIDTSTDQPAMALLTRDGRRHAATGGRVAGDTGGIWFPSSGT